MPTPLSAACVQSAPGASIKGGAILAARQLGKRYRSGAGMLTVFQNLNVSILSGEMVAILGESGSGKSTLLHLLGALDTPSEGDVYFAARNLRELSDDQLAGWRNREIGFVWQFHYLLPEFTALENVMLPVLVNGGDEAAAATLARQGLQQVGLAERATHRSGELSGGEQQRVALARALVMSPKLLLADEPTGNLDESTGARIFDLLLELHRQRGLTSIIVTHNQTHAARCDRVLRLRGGALEEIAARNGEAGV